MASVKKIARLVTVVTVAFLLVSSCTLAWASVPFHDLSFPEALERAKREDKPLFVDVYATWCGPCKVIEEKVFSRPDFAAAAAAYVAIRIDAEQAGGPSLIKRFHVTGYPTLLFLTPDGAEIDRLFGVTDAAEIVTALTDFRNNRGTLGDLEDRLADAGRGAPIELLYEVGYRHALRGNARVATKLLARAIALDPENESGHASRALHALGALLHRPAERWDAAIAALSRLRDRFPDSEEAGKALRPLALSYLKLGRNDKVRHTLDLLLEGDPDQGAYNAYAWFCFRRKYDFRRGIEVARMGLERFPEDAGMWDTLAELYYALGDRGKAVAAIEKAIEKTIEHEPKKKYYRDQLERFRKPPATKDGK